MRLILFLLILLLPQISFAKPKKVFTVNADLLYAMPIYVDTASVKIDTTKFLRAGGGCKITIMFYDENTFYVTQDLNEAWCNPSSVCFYDIVDAKAHVGTLLRCFHDLESRETLAIQTFDPFIYEHTNHVAVSVTYERVSANATLSVLTNSKFLKCKRKNEELFKISYRDDIFDPGQTFCIDPYFCANGAYATRAFDSYIDSNISTAKAANYRSYERCDVLPDHAVRNKTIGFTCKTGYEKSPKYNNYGATGDSICTKICPTGSIRKENTLDNCIKCANGDIEETFLYDVFGLLVEKCKPLPENAVRTKNGFTCKKGFKKAPQYNNDGATGDSICTKICSTGYIREENSLNNCIKCANDEYVEKTFLYDDLGLPIEMCQQLPENAVRTKKGFECKKGYKISLVTGDSLCTKDCPIGFIREENSLDKCIKCANDEYVEKTFLYDDLGLPIEMCLQLPENTVRTENGFECKEGFVKVIDECVQIKTGAGRVQSR